MAALIKKWALYPYSCWVYTIFFVLAGLGALGYALLALLSPQAGRERRLLYINNGIAVIWAALCGMRLKMERPASLDPKGVYVFTPNHSSTLDMLIGSYAFRHGMRFLVKEELKSFPILGFMFSQIGVFVRREDPASRKASRETLRDWARKGISFCVFPEGTRNKNPEPLGPFRDGAFDAAISAGIPIAPIIFLGTRKLMPLDSWLVKPGTLESIYLDPVPTQGMSMEDLPALKEKVYLLMRRAMLEREPLQQPFKRHEVSYK